MSVTNRPTQTGTARTFRLAISEVKALAMWTSERLECKDPEKGLCGVRGALPRLETEV